MDNLNAVADLHAKIPKSRPAVFILLVRSRDRIETSFFIKEVVKQIGEKSWRRK